MILCLRRQVSDVANLGVRDAIAIRKIRLQVENRSAIEQVMISDMQHSLLNTNQADTRHANQVWTLRSTRRKHSALLLITRRTDL